MYLEPEVLIISNLFDFSTDFITTKLREAGVSFLRLNRDDLRDYKIEFDPCAPHIIAEVEGQVYKVSQSKLKSIYYRAPTFLREIFQEKLEEEDQLYRTQWAAFVRSLIVFENVKWVNNPVATYRAEMKPFQLYLAKKIGFVVPDTIIANHTFSPILTDKIAIKSIDTAIVGNGDDEAFIYTSILESAALGQEQYSSPFFIQQAIVPKIDLRITVIDKVVIPIKIECEGGIPGDWRKHKGPIKYHLFELPPRIKDYCLQLSKQLGLVFCAIDMAQRENEYYFIEVNPTGEWAWLQKNTGYEFDKEITRALTWYL